MVSCGITIEKINAFRAAMIDGTPETVTADIATYSITKTLTDVTVSNGAASVQQYQPFIAIHSVGLTADALKAQNPSK